MMRQENLNNQLEETSELIPRSLSPEPNFLLRIQALEYVILKDSNSQSS